MSEPQSVIAARDLFEPYLRAYFTTEVEQLHRRELETLVSAMMYSTVEGGKRFRPLLSLLVASALNKSMTEVLPVALAVEFIHCYSLIHDDLPCMDDDDYRRGRLTNHKKFGEATALLAGDALLTESFGLIAQACVTKPSKCVPMIQRMCRAIGIHGMVGGQAIDISLQTEKQSNAEILSFMHQLKTGELIRFSVWASAFLLDASDEELQAIDNFGLYLGEAFQLADDLLDIEEGEVQAINAALTLSVVDVQQKLELQTKAAFAQLQSFGAKADGLRHLAQINLDRTQVS